MSTVHWCPRCSGPDVPHWDTLGELKMHLQKVHKVVLKAHNVVAGRVAGE